MLYNKEHPSLKVDPSSYTTLLNYNSSGVSRVAKLAPMVQLPTPYSATTIQPRAPVFLPSFGSTGYNTLTGPARPGGSAGFGYFTLNEAYAR